MRRIKDYSTLREGDPTKVQRDKGRADLRDYSMKHKVSMYWDLNEDSKIDQMFILRIDNIEVILDSEDLQRYLRWV
jgi:hypothetical protein